MLQASTPSCLQGIKIQSSLPPSLTYFGGRGGRGRRKVAGGGREGGEREWGREVGWGREGWRMRQEERRYLAWAWRSTHPWRVAHR